VLFIVGYSSARRSAKSALMSPDDCWIDLFAANGEDNSMTEDQAPAAPCTHLCAHLYSDALSGTVLYD